MEARYVRSLENTGPLDQVPTIWIDEKEWRIDPRIRFAPPTQKDGTVQMYIKSIDTYPDSGYPEQVQFYYFNATFATVESELKQFEFDLCLYWDDLLGMDINTIEQSHETTDIERLHYSLLHHVKYKTFIYKGFSQSMYSAANLWDLAKITKSVYDISFSLISDRYVIRTLELNTYEKEPFSWFHSNELFAEFKERWTKAIDDAAPVDVDGVESALGNVE